MWTVPTKIHKYFESLANLHPISSFEKTNKQNDFIFWKYEFSLPCDQEVRFRHWPNDSWNMFHFFFSQWKGERFVREANKHENVLLLLTFQIGFLLNTTGLAVVSEVSWMLYTGLGCHFYVGMPSIRTKVIFGNHHKLLTLQTHRLQTMWHWIQDSVWKRQIMNILSWCRPARRHT